MATRRIRLTLTALLIAQLVAVPLLAAPPAQPAPSVEASMVAKQAIDYYQNGQFALAAELYRRAFRIDSTKPDYLFGVGRAEQKAGHVKEARLAFEMLRGILPSTDPLYKKCQQALDDLDKSAQAPPPDKPPVVPAPAVAPTPAPVVVAPTPAKPPEAAPPKAAVVPAKPAIETVTAPQQVTKPMDTTLVGWTLIGTGGALFIAGLSVALSTLSDVSAWNRDSGTLGNDGRITGTDYQTAASTVSSLNTRVGVGVGIGAGGLACAGVGTWLLLHDRTKVSVLPSGNGIVIGGRF